MTSKARQKRENIKQSKGESIWVIILGAGDRDFHNFNTFFRRRPLYRVVAFTATQIPFIATPTDLRRKIKIHQPTARVLYDFDIDLSPYVEGFMEKGIPPSPKRSKKV